MNKSHKIKLYPTKRQGILFKKSCGVARYSYNWALSKWKELYELGQKPSAYSLIKLQNSIKGERMPFFAEVSKCAPQYAIHNLENAFKKMWKGDSGYPKYKKKGVRDSFVAIENKISFKQKDYKIWIPRIGWVKCAENLRFEGNINNVTVKRIADIWFAVINIEVPNSTPALKQEMGNNQAIVGVDLGIKTMITLSDGITFENPKALKKNLKRLKRYQRSLSRKKKGSNNRRKQQMKVARLHYRISCIRNNAIHQATSFIVNNYDKVIIEDLNVRGMMKNKSLSQAIGDVSFSELTRQLAYKAAWNGVEVVKADRFFASSKTCSNCGHKKELLKLSERTFNCENCGISIDRDLNAAINLSKYSTPKCGETKACGDGSSVNESLHSPSTKQEINTLSNLIVQRCTLS